MTSEQREQTSAGLYFPDMEHDACGIGAIVNIRGIRSHSLVDRTLRIVERLEHRAGKDAEEKTGDGVGILLQISHKFFQSAAVQAEIALCGAGSYGVGMFFLPQAPLLCLQRKKMFELMVEKEGMTFLGWRQVPVHPEKIGSRAVSCMPDIQQAFVQKPQDCPAGLDFDRRLYIVRRIFEQAAGEDCYVCSFSSRTIVYKGMLLVHELRTFYEDLQSPDYESAIAITHSRFSTNTNPSWERAHPYRYLVHNGEINTIRGNVDKMSVREEAMTSPPLAGQLHKVLPVVDAQGSDSAMLDNTLEFLMMNGMELPHAVMSVIPEPWQHDKTISRVKRDFYQYHAILMEPWDGPAAILFSDGDVVGAVLDRNGLRPARYYITREDELILSSEVGVAEVPEGQIVRKDRLRPGKMLLIDTRIGEVIDDEALKNRYACQYPYGEWLDNQMIRMEDLHAPNKSIPAYSPLERTQLKRVFGYSYEDYRNTILKMAATGQEPITSMGTDTPLPVQSNCPQPLFSYFKQQFAQVTNPPIDAIREKLVIDTNLYIGASGNLLEPREENCNSIALSSPILTDLDLLKLKSLRIRGFRVGLQSILYYRSTSLKKALDRLFIEVDKACKDGVNVLILSDRGVDEYHVAIPSLLAVSAVHQHLVQTKHGANVSLILESGEPRGVHDFATLLGYGACAVNPYLAHDSIRQLIEEKLLDKDPYQAIEDYNRAVKRGIVKIASKMGISTLQSYQGSKIFEAVGLSRQVTDAYFTGTASRIGGIGLEEIQRQVEQLHTHTFDPLGFAVDLSLESEGLHRFRSGKEKHRYNPATIALLQQAVHTGNYELFKQYTALLRSQKTNLRSLFQVRWPKEGIPLDEVEPAAEIVKRFRTGAMSFGSLSPEAHETLAIAMNRLGGRSNSGEGGELPERLHCSADGVNRCSAVKQVASGRFGVTSEYLISAQELQIKMAQGAKPGEGGHLPGEKVYPWVARTRCSTPGISLISPPPHHDIYSIEDLAQLIYDLKNANDRAEISVKLVSEFGVGTVASGVAKAGAGIILISGYDGGTGAAPNSSIYNAGLPWEIGLSEAHQALRLNGLRSRVRLEADGKLMSGYDILIAAALGADGFGFATAPLVALGCVMMRACNLDSCPVGIATQNPALRKNFTGKPEDVETLMCFFAQELREYMARLGIPTVDQLVGRTDLLSAPSPEARGKEDTLDLSPILAQIGQEVPQAQAPFDFHLEETLDRKVLLPAFSQALKTGTPQSITLTVRNTDRTFGTLFGNKVTRRFGDTLPDDTFVVHCTGSGGQSFGAFLPHGVTLQLTGDSNDYLGKGLSGGKIVVRPPEDVCFVPHENILLGNVALYGATAGTVFLAGVAGERFCVRNSGATAVVEGVGNHGCEYMTGGRVVVLGEIGANFAAGMSGGIAYVLDENNDLYLRLNKEVAAAELVTEPADIQELQSLISSHVSHTGSAWGQTILKEFSHYLPLFKKVAAQDYLRMCSNIHQLEAQGMAPEQASMMAFYEERKWGEHNGNT